MLRNICISFVNQNCCYTECVTMRTSLVDCWDMWNSKYVRMNVFGCVCCCFPFPLNMHRCMWVYVHECATEIVIYLLCFVINGQMCFLSMAGDDVRRYLHWIFHRLSSHSHSPFPSSLILHSGCPYFWGLRIQILMLIRCGGLGLGWCWCWIWVVVVAFPFATWSQKSQQQRLGMNKNVRHEVI